MSLFDYPVMLFKMFLPNKEQTLHFAEIGWTITIPKGFTLLSSQKMKNMNERAQKKFAAAEAPVLKHHPVKHQFWASYEIQNLFGCSITDLNEVPEAAWKAHINDVCNAMLAHFNNYYKEYSNVTITTENDLRQKDAVTFDTFDIIAATPTGKIFTVRYYRAVIKNYGLHITMSFPDNNVGEKMLNALRASTFGE